MCEKAWRLVYKSVKGIPFEMTLQLYQSTSACSTKLNESRVQQNMRCFQFMQSGVYFISLYSMLVILFSSLCNLWPKNKLHQQYLEHPMGRCANHVTDLDVQNIYTVWTSSSPIHTKIMQLVIVVLNLKPVLLSANNRNRPAAADRSGNALSPT
jgi:hypothetical protein